MRIERAALVATVEGLRNSAEQMWEDALFARQKERIDPIGLVGYHVGKLEGMAAMLGFYLQNEDHTRGEITVPVRHAKEGSGVGGEGTEAPAQASPSPKTPDTHLDGSEEGHPGVG